MLDYNLNNIHEWPRSAKIIFIVLICGAVLYLAYYLDFSNLRTQLKTNQKLELDLKEQLTLLYKQQGEIGKDTAQYKQLEVELSKWQSQLVKQPALSELLNEILKAGSASGIQFVAFTPGEDVKESIYTKVPIKAQIIGSYHQIASFMSRIANMPVIVAIHSFTIAAQAEKKSTPGNESTQLPTNSLMAEINLDIYYLNGNTNNEPKK